MGSRDANLDPIAAVPGIDVLHVGSNDLLADMGNPGQFDCPEIIEAQARVIAAAIRAGALFVTTQTDIAFMMTAATQWTQAEREALVAGK